jgi:hypothetical protein
MTSPTSNDMKVWLESLDDELRTTVLASRNCSFEKTDADSFNPVNVPISLFTLLPSEPARQGVRRMQFRDDVAQYLRDNAADVAACHNHPDSI